MGTNLEVNSLCMGCMQGKSGQAVCNQCGFDESKKRSPIYLPYRIILNGQYLIGKVLGKKPGGFGITYLAFDLNLEIPVAVKEYFPKEMVGRDSDNRTVILHSDSDFSIFDYGLKQFREESKILARFKHPNIVRALNFFTENETGYLVMEYYSNGISLDEFIDQKGKLSEELTLDIILPLLDGLKEVHSKKYLHRDIKPQNIFIVKNKPPVLLDFGAARLAFEEKSQSLSEILSPGYAPPEQYNKNGKQGAWTDIYGIGATIYKMVTGSVPSDAIARLGGEKLIPLSETGNKISSAFSDIIMKSLSIDIGTRYQNAKDFQESLFNLKNDEPKSSKKYNDKFFIVLVIFVVILLGLFAERYIKTKKLSEQLVSRENTISSLNYQINDRDTRINGLQNEITSYLNIISELNTEKPIYIRDIQFQPNKNGYFSSYSLKKWETNYIYFKIFYDSYIKNNETITLNFKIFNSYGGLIQGDDESLYDYSFVGKADISGDFSKFSDVVVSSGFGRVTYGNYSEGEYKVEIWYKERKLAEKYFQIEAGGEIPQE